MSDQREIPDHAPTRADGACAAPIPVGTAGCLKYLPIREQVESGLATALLGLAVISFILFVVCDYRHVRDLERSIPAPQIDASSATGYADGVRNGMLLPQGNDGYLWIIYAQQMAQEGGSRQRWTSIDNAPDGREIHWDNGLIWWLAAWGWIVHWGAGEPLPIGIEHAAQFALPLLYAACLLPLGAWAWRRWGPLPGAIMVSLLLVLAETRETWGAGYYDHHGPVALAITASLLLALLAHRRPGDEPSSTHSAAYASGAFASAALWISAATAIPAIASMCIGGGLAMLCRRDPQLGLFWRKWGRAACVASLLFYAMEYFPNHTGLRLEVNNPLYALACWCAGESLYHFCTQLDAGSIRGGSAAMQGLCLAGIALPGVLAMAFDHRFFWVADRFLLGLHLRYIGEFQPVFPQFASLAALRNPDTVALLLLTSLLLAAGWLVLRRRETRPLLALAIMPTLTFLALAIWQRRWIVGYEACLIAMVTTLTWIALECCGRTWTGKVLLMLCVGPILCTVPSLASRVASLRQHRLTLDQFEITQLVCRHAAHDLRASWASPRRPVVLAGPSVSAMIAYWGNVQAIGTLYWENLPGLRKAAETYACTTPDELTAHLKGTTHIVMFGLDDSPRHYLDLLGKDPATAPLVKLLENSGQPIPGFAPVPYQTPEWLGGEGFWIRMLQVNKKTTP